MKVGIPSPNQEKPWFLFLFSILLHWCLQSLSCDCPIKELCYWLLLHLCTDNFCFLCSSSSHDDQEQPQGSSWHAEELGPRLCGSLQLDHGHLLSGEPCYGPVSKSPPILLCTSSINVSSVSYHFSGCFRLVEKHQTRIFLAFSPQA